jgi:hypothetical protein
VAPASLQRFMDDCVRTFEQLEALLWFFAHQNESITVGSLAQTLGIAEPVLQEAVDGLVASNLLAHVAGSLDLIRYEPVSRELGENVERLAALHAQDRFEVVRVVAQNSMLRLRKSALQTFADCFVLRKPVKRG